MLPIYNEANFLASLKVQIRGQGALIDFLKDQEYDAKGQRQFAYFGNETFTRYSYDPDSFRLINLLTYKSGDNPRTAALQDLHYTYDPVGNIVSIKDDAQQTHFYNNTVVKPTSLFEYDALYHLIMATGREHAGLANETILNYSDLGFVRQLPHQNDISAVRTYIEEYDYDLLGNIKLIQHHFKTRSRSGGDGWVRHYRYAYEDDPTNCTNQLRSTSLPGDPDLGPYGEKYDYDAYGNMFRLPSLTELDWDFMDQLRQVDLGGGGKVFYIYGMGRQRMRKVIERSRYDTD
jgi:hypothetical protein